MSKRQMDVVISVMCGKHFSKHPMVTVYANSLSQYSTADKVLLVNEIESQNLKRFQNLGFQVYPVSPEFSLIHDRWRLYHDFLRSHDYRYAILSDCKDVLWQRDPFPTLEKEIGNDEVVLLFDEGMDHKQSEWNHKDQTSWRRNLARNFNQDFDNWRVINGGIQMGSSKKLEQLCFEMSCANFNAMQPSYSDQAVLNYLFREKNDPNYRIAPAELFLNATGETIHRINPPEYHWKDGKLLMNDNVISAFHQWDRTPYRSEILTKYGHSQ